MSRHVKRLLYWENPGPRGQFQVEFIDWFDARGMRPVYQRSEHFGIYNVRMNVWQAREGRVVARLWSRCKEVDDYCIQVAGFSGPKTPRDSTASCGEHWIPECLRAEYESWVISEIPFIISGRSWCMFLKAPAKNGSARMVRRPINNAPELIAARSARIRQLLTPEAQEFLAAAEKNRN